MRKSRKRTLAIACAFAAIGAVRATSAASAADMPVKTPMHKAPPPAVILSWTGFHGGVHGGGDWFNNDWFTPLSAINTAGGGCFGCPAPAGSHTSSNSLFGGQVGFNYQVGWWVWGVEAQASWTKLEGSNVNLLSPTVTIHSRTDTLGTIAARPAAQRPRCTATSDPKGRHDATSTPRHTRRHRRRRQPPGARRGLAQHARS